MFRLFNRFQIFFSPEDSLGVAEGDKTPAGGDKEDDIKFLGGDDKDDKDDILDLDDKKGKKKDDKEDDKDDDKDDEKKDEEDDDEKEDEKDELEELVDELEDPTDEQLELTTPVRRKEILKKYPTLFKDFPYLEKAYYREQQFTELLPTIDDARAAVESRETLAKFETDLMGGNVETILKAVKDENNNSFYKIVDDLLPTLAKVDEQAYHHVLGNTVKHTIAAMVQEGRASKNDVLLSAAQILNQFVFGSSDFKPPTKLAGEDKKDDNNKDTELNKREREFNRRQFETARDGLNTRVNNSVKSTIEANIDPKSSMSDYVKRNAIRECEETVGKLISQDRRFATIVDRLWEDAFKKGFSKESVDRIRSAYLSKAKVLLPTVIKKARNEALRGMGKRVKDDVDDKADNSPEGKEKPRSERSGKIKEAKDIPKGMRTIDFLNSD